VKRPGIADDAGEHHHQQREPHDCVICVASTAWPSPKALLRVYCAETSKARESRALTAQTVVRGTGIESVTACQTARTLAPNLLSPNLCGAQDTVHGLPSGGCGDSNTERQFPAHKVYRRDYRGIVGVESLSSQGLAFVIIHVVLDARPGRAVPKVRVLLVAFCSNRLPGARRAHRLNEGR